MLKRFLVCLLSALIVAVPVSAHAWSNDSFIGADYSDTSSTDSPALFSAALSDTSAEPDKGTFVGDEILPLLSVGSESALVGMEFVEFDEGRHDNLVDIPDYSWYTFRPNSGLAVTSTVFGPNFVVSMPSTSISPMYDKFTEAHGLVTSPADDDLFGSHSSINSIGYSRIALDIDMSKLPENVSDIEFNGSVRAQCNYKVGSNTGTVYAYACALYVNGAPTDVSFSAVDNVIQFNNYLFSSDVPIERITLMFSINPFSKSFSSSSSQTCYWSTYFGFTDSRFSFIAGSGEGVVDTDKVQGELGQHEELESNWGGSMTDNFNALDIGNFTYPDGLASAFALISGIFQDFWYGMGEYAIAYVFPLTLAIMLLVIGRLSKFAGRSARSSGKDEGS